MGGADDLIIISNSSSSRSVGRDVGGSGRGSVGCGSGGARDRSDEGGASVGAGGGDQRRKDVIEFSFRFWATRDDSQPQQYYT